MSAVNIAAFVDRVADAASASILPFFRTAMGADDKSSAGAPFDPVTEADRAAEVAMRRVIEAQFPDHGIVGEEFGATRAEAEYVWVLDPIDGTKSFISGVPTWGTLIGFTHHAHAVYGMLAQPYLGERFSGDGAAAWLETCGVEGRTARRALTTRRCATLSAATLMTTSPLLFEPDRLDRFRRVEAAVRLSRYGFDCYAYAMLALGFVDCVVESGLKAHDVAALVPIVRGAGGVITAWDGGAPDGGGDIVAAGDPRVHAAALRVLAG